MLIYLNDQFWVVVVYFFNVRKFEIQAPSKIVFDAVGKLIKCENIENYKNHRHIREY